MSSNVISIFRRKPAATKEEETERKKANDRIIREWRLREDSARRRDPDDRKY